MALSHKAELPSLVLTDQGYCLTGHWTTHHIQALQRVDLPRLTGGVIDWYSEIQSLDTNGAVFLLKLIKGNQSVWPKGLLTAHERLLKYVDQYAIEVPAKAPELNMLADVGYRATQMLAHGRELLEFFGRLSALLFSLLLHPRQLKIKMLLGVVQRDGLHAVPIIALLAFLLGAVIAYQGGLQLATYGANIFIVELVSLTMLRELAPLICAIIVAGRSGSSYAAQLATMQMNQEVLALRSLGQDPFAWLILPKLLGLMLVMPLLTLLSMFAGIAGGMVVASLQLGLSPLEFLQRFGTEVAVIHVWVGLIKAPVFALLIVNVGCMQGLLAKGGAEAVGHSTTRSVVQGIFLVIIADALFSVLFAQLGW